MATPSPEPTDAGVIARSLTEPEAFTAIFARHFDALHRYLARRVGAGAADELASEVFARAFEHRARFDGAHAGAAPWLYGIAANLIARRRRDERRALRALARAAERPEGAEEADAAIARADAASERARLAAALADLRRQDREALLLVAWADLTYPEAASALGVPVGTVRSRIHRARARMAAALDDAGAGTASATPLPGEPS